MPVESGDRAGTAGGRYERSYFDVRVFNPHAPTNAKFALPAVYKRHGMSRRSVAATRNGSPTSSTPPSHQLSCPALEGMAKLQQHSMLGWHRCSPTRSRSRTLPQSPTSDVSSALPSSVLLLPVCEAIGTEYPQMQTTRPDLRLPHEQHRLKLPPEAPY